MFRFSASNVARTVMRGKVTSTACNTMKVNSFATYKTSTGLVGLAVDPNGRENLQAISQKVLDAAKVSFLLCNNIRQCLLKLTNLLNCTRNFLLALSIVRILSNGLIT